MCYYIPCTSRTHTYNKEPNAIMLVAWLLTLKIETNLRFLLQWSLLLTNHESTDPRLETSGRIRPKASAKFAVSVPIQGAAASEVVSHQYMFVFLRSPLI